MRSDAGKARAAHRRLDSDGHVQRLLARGILRSRLISGRRHASNREQGVHVREQPVDVGYELDHVEGEDAVKWAAQFAYGVAPHLANCRLALRNLLAEPVRRLTDHDRRMIDPQHMSTGQVRSTGLERETGTAADFQNVVPGLRIEQVDCPEVPPHIGWTVRHHEARSCAEQASVRGRGVISGVD